MQPDWYGQVGAHGVYDVVITTTWATDNQPFLVAAMGLRLLQLASVEALARPPLPASSHAYTLGLA